MLGLLAFLVVVLIGLGISMVAYAGVARTLPPPDQLITRANQGQTTRIFDREGNLLQAPLAPGDPTAGLRRNVPLSEISPYLVQATVATEDANFYKHRGVDPVALSRAVFRAAQNRGPVVGTSTISQQLVKLVFLSPERTVSRKVKEAVLSAEITRRYPKDKILELYLNEIYYGNLAYGAEEAARLYFNKPAKELTLAEASLLAGLPQAPASYDPLQNPEAAKGRQSDVLRLMVENGDITPEEADAAWQEPLTYYGQGLESTRLGLAPHYVMYVRSQIEQLYGPELLYRGGLQVYTTLDRQRQELAEAEVRQGVANLQGRNVSNGALVSIDPRTGEIQAMVGSADFNNPEISGQVNVATSLRQPGSTIKPFTYLATFERPNDWWTPATLIEDVRTEFNDGPGRPPYVPHNYDGRERGWVSVRTALANSLNIPAVKALDAVGVNALLDVADRFGMKSLTRPGHPPYGLALTLGGGEVTLLELAGAYGALANNGVYVSPRAILCIVDANGDVLERVDAPDLPEACRNAPVTPNSFIQPVDGQRVTSPEHAYLLTDILKDNEARAMVFGVDSWLRIDRPAAVKTGTTDDIRDIWTVGYTPQLVTGVWVGNADGTPMAEGLSGIAGAAPIWNGFMRRSLANEPATDFAVPDGIEYVEICTLTGAPPDGSCPPDRRRTEVFAAGQAPGGAPQPSQPQQVLIAEPQDGQTIQGVVRVVGSATVPDFDHYLVEYGESFEPGAWGAVAGPVYQSVEMGELAQWNVDNLATEGPHVLRVVAVDRQGVRHESPAVRVFVAHAAPTVAPIDTPTPTETPFPTPTLLPVETPTPLPSPTALPTLPPTPELPTPTATAPLPTATPEEPTPTPPPAAALQALIDGPQNGSTLSGAVSVTGVAGGSGFASYQLQFGQNGNWQAVSPDAVIVTTPVTGQLGLWETSGLPNGPYELRLIVFGFNGETQEAIVGVNVEN